MTLLTDKGSDEMADIKAVLKAWECCHPFNRQCDKCPYDADCYHDEFCRYAISDMVELLKEQQQIVRCKDCKHSSFDGWGRRGCELIERRVKDDFFCADGEA